MRYRDVAFVWVALAASSGSAPGEPLVFERFEGSVVGNVEGEIRFTPEVVGHGGLAAANGQAAVFDGKRDTCVSYPATTRVASTDFTVEAFVQPARRPRYEAIAADWSEDGDNRSWALVLLPNGGLRFDVSPDGRFYVENKLETPPRMLRTGTWYHVAAVSRGDGSRIYVNGREMASTTRPKPGIFTENSARLKIGNVDRYATDGPRPFRGSLDEVRITERALGPGDFLQTKDPMPEVTGPVPGSYELPFVATTEADARAWQERARARLFELVEAQQPRYSTEEVPIDFQLGEKGDGTHLPERPGGCFAQMSPVPFFAEDRGAYTLHKASFRGNAKERTRYPCLFAVPKGEGPFPAMLCIHGHGGSAEASFDPKTVYHGFADRFARGGYVVLAPSFPHRDYCAMMLWDLFRCVDVLASRPEVDRERLGVAGLSMGGEWTMWIAACDDRLQVAVVSGWMCTTEGVFSVPNCACWELPGFVGLMDVCEVHLLIAPRPVLFESAQFDPCFPIHHTKQGYARICAGYRVFDAEGVCRQDVWPAGHQWHGAVAYPFVDKVLGGRAADVQ